MFLLSSRLYICFVSKKSFHSNSASSNLSIALIFSLWILWTIIPITLFFSSTPIQIQLIYNDSIFFWPLFKFCLLPKPKAHAYFLFFYDLLLIIQSNQALFKPASCDETKHWLQKVLKIHCFTFKNSYTCKLLALQALKQILSTRRKS